MKTRSRAPLAAPSILVILEVLIFSAGTSYGLLKWLRIGRIEFIFFTVVTALVVYLLITSFHWARNVFAVVFSAIWGMSVYNMSGLLAKQTLFSWILFAGVFLISLYLHFRFMSRRQAV